MSSLSSVYLLFLYAGSCIYGQNFSPEMCIDGKESSVGIYLNRCSTGTVIHVREEIIGKADESCVRDNTCLIGRSDTDTGLSVNCNGLQTCREYVTNPKDRCDSPKLSVRVWYECIRGSVDICSQIDVSKNGSVYLHSPSFPDSVGFSAVCSCSITGSHMRVELLEQYDAHVLNISADGVNVWPAPRKLPIQYNAPVVQSAAFLRLVYVGVSDNVKQNAWVKITDGGAVNVTCSGNSTEIPSPASTTSTTSPTTSFSTVDYSTASLTHSAVSSTSWTATIHRNTTLTTTSTITTTVSSEHMMYTSDDRDSGLPIEMIAGIAGGGGVLLIITVVVVVACRLKRKREADKSMSNLERQEDYSTVDCDPVGNGNPYVDTPTTDRHSSFQRQSGDGSGKNGANANHDSKNLDVYNKIIHPKLRNSAPTDDFESEQTYNHIPSRNDTDKSSQHNGHGLDVDEYDDTYNTNIRSELKDRKKHIKDSEQTYDHIPSFTYGVSKDITNDTSSNTYYNISGPTSGISDNTYNSDNSEQTYDHLASSGANNKSDPKCPPNPSKTEVSSDVSAMYTTVVRPPGHTSTENRNDGQQKDSPDSIPMGVLTSESKVAVEDVDIYYKPPVPEKLFSEDDDEEEEMGEDAENGRSHKVPCVTEKPVMEDNDLYHSYKTPKARKPYISSKGKTQSVGRSTEGKESDENGRPEPERPEMVDNDLYHSYKK